MNKKTVSTKDIAIAALLTALSILIPLFMPIKLVLEPIFSATFAAHVPGILAMFIGPFAVVGTAIGSTAGFLMNGLGPWVAARAFMHLFFGLLGWKMLQKKYNIFLTVFATGIVHAVAEMLVAAATLLFTGTGSLFFIFVTVGCGTFIHHCIDFVISGIILGALKSSKLLNSHMNFKSFKG
ncbi:MAG: ECF transporter S component [Clostridia bacterium]|nr:ECF transporter S component [Clostridia bacterium]